MALFTRHLFCVREREREGGREERERERERGELFMLKIKRKRCWTERVFMHVNIVGLSYKSVGVTVCTHHFTSLLKANIYTTWDSLSAPCDLCKITSC